MGAGADLAERLFRVSGWRPRHGHLPTRDCANVRRRIIAAIIIGPLLAWLTSAALVVIWSQRDASRPASAIVVLGAAQYVGRPSPVLKARLDHAIALWKNGLAPVLVVTGGKGPRDTTSEAEASYAYAVKQGVPDSAILVESVGRTSDESMRAVADTMRARGMRDAVLVSDPFHMLRLQVLATQLGITPYTSPTQTSPISANRELVAEYVLSESVKVPFTLLFARRRSR
jgi:uncharacterized SAM-binding protein YcdF (DUF218 family)